MKNKYTIEYAVESPSTLYNYLEVVFFSNQVKSAMKGGVGTTQEALSEATGISRTNICNLANGLMLPKMSTVQKIAIALDKDVTFFFIPCCLLRIHPDPEFPQTVRSIETVTVEEYLEIILQNCKAARRNAPLGDDDMLKAIELVESHCSVLQRYV